MSIQKIVRCSLLFAALVLAACASAPPDPVGPTAEREQAITRLACTATLDCGTRGGACRDSVCRADNECRTDADCAAGRSCVADDNFGGLCAESAELVPTPLPATRCSSIGLCPPGQLCAADGTCRPARVCRTDRDCRKGMICDPATGHCTTPPPRCKVDTDCPSGEVCDAASGRCIAPPPRCRVNSDCRGGQVCDPATGHCIADPHCIPRSDGTCCDPTKGPCPTVSCTADSDCPSGWLCRRPDPSDPHQICAPK